MSKKIIMKIGDTYNLTCGSVATIKNINNYGVFVETNSGYTLYANRTHLKNGNIKDPLWPSKADNGFIGIGEFGTKDISYYRWRKILKRVYIQNNENGWKRRSCTVCKEWHNYQNFAKWHEKSNYKEGWFLDKDLKIPGNKEYSPESCIYVPSDINNLFYTPKKNNGLMLGISLKSKKYWVNNHTRNDWFYNYEDAKKRYMELKLITVKEKINKYPEFEEILLNYYNWFKIENYFVESTNEY